MTLISIKNIHQKNYALLWAIFLCILCPLLYNCEGAEASQIEDQATEQKEHLLLEKSVETYELIQQEVKVGDYYTFMDSLSSKWSSKLTYSVDEYSLVFKNKWIIDTLARTDYYVQKKLENFIYDSKEMSLFNSGDTLYIPSQKEIHQFNQLQAQTWIDINIPEYKLRIRRGDSILMTVPVRVGRKEKKYLAMAKREVDLRTHVGAGEIVRINRNPSFINPTNNKVYEVTRRDDGQVTTLPIVPWIEPMIDEHRYGQLIHPTTNPNTLGKAYSNGCIGVGEADMWRVYFYAPLKTKVIIRYDLRVVDEHGNEVVLPDIYGKSRKNHHQAMLLPYVQDDCICLR